MYKIFIAVVIFLPLTAISQNKKPLTHDVYDNWKSVNETAITNNGQFVAYTIQPQEGDGTLIVHPLTDTIKKLQFPRGATINFTNNNQFLIAKIKAPFKDIRQAKIKKTKPDDFPKDSLLVLNLLNDSVVKIPQIKSFKTPENNDVWLAVLTDTSTYQYKKDSVAKDTANRLTIISDSIIQKSLANIRGRKTKEKLKQASANAANTIGQQAKKISPAKTPAKIKPSTGKDLLLLHLTSGECYTFHFITDYYFDKNGNTLLLKTDSRKDTLAVPQILLYHLKNKQFDTIMTGFNDVKNFSPDERGKQWAFVAERDSTEKSLQKFYKLWYYQTGMDSAKLLVQQATKGIPANYTVNPFEKIQFSKDGKKLFFGVWPIMPPADTSLVDFETAKLDIWHYNDDYIQPQQLKRLTYDKNKSGMAVIQPETTAQVVQLTDTDIDNTTLIDEGNANWVLAQTTQGNRIAASWEGMAKNTAYIINTANGQKQLVQQNLYANFQASPKGKYIFWYNAKSKNYFTYNIENGATINISKKIPQPVYDIENDMPAFPRAMGIEGWTANDECILLKSFYDIWLVSPNGNKTPINLTKTGSTEPHQFNIITIDKEKKFFLPTDTLYITAQNLHNKTWSVYTKTLNSNKQPALQFTIPKSISGFSKAKEANAFLLQLSNVQSSELFASQYLHQLQQVTNIAAQQQPYIWLTAEQVRWKMFDGKMSDGILYKPENFNSNKKYPLLLYFYEKRSNTIFSYTPPAPSASTINIPYFVSNGYMVFVPDIYYTIGEPGQSAYNSVVSAAKFLSKKPWIDSSRMGIQGQSWGGYQVAYLVTRTNIFKAAGAGAPVSNMTSAYGGIRWGTGLLRQFQYEKTQSRLGATLWQRPDLYIKNSPLFKADKINTPLLIMHNDADGAVPWYQGIELYSALRRLRKPVWLLQYNDEDHNLKERKNRKDLSVRLAQFFDYYLKGANAPVWLLQGVPAIKKGQSWGLEVENANNTPSAEPYQK
ncbi:MAG: alpha/beta hydrolase family protein [Niabella sp.]